MPNGASAPGNVSTWPTTAPPLPVPIRGSTRLTGLVTTAGWVPARAAAWETAAAEEEAAAETAEARDVVAETAETAEVRDAAAETAETAEARDAAAAVGPMARAIATLAPVAATASKRVRTGMRLSSRP